MKKAAVEQRQVSGPERRRAGRGDEERRTLGLLGVEVHLLAEERNRGILEVLQLLRGTARVRLHGLGNGVRRWLRSERRGGGLAQRRAERAACRSADHGPERA